MIELKVPPHFIASKRLIITQVEAQAMADQIAVLEEKCADIEARCGNLLAALELAEPFVERAVDISGYKTHKERKVLVAVRAAIAKVAVAQI